MILRSYNQLCCYFEWNLEVCVFHCKQCLSPLLSVPQVSQNILPPPNYTPLGLQFLPVGSLGMRCPQ